MSKAGDGKTKPVAIAHLASRWTLPAALAFVFVCIVVAGAAVSPYLFQATTLEREIALQLRATTGLTLTAKMTGVFELLPRPHVVLDAPHVADAAGGFTLDADSLDGDVRLLPLLVGRVELVSAKLVRPRVAVDLAIAPLSAESLIGQALRANGPIEPGDRQRLGTVTFVDGSAVIKAPAWPRPRNLKAVDATLDWRDLDSPATLTGFLLLDDVPTDVAAWVAQPANLLRGDHSAVALRVHAAPIDLSASGDLVRGATTTFHGHLSAATPSVPGILGLLRDDTTLLAPFANVTLVSDSSIALDAQGQPSIDLQNLKLRADGNDYEGTLGFIGGPRPTLSGTLATELLSLRPFLYRMPTLLDAGRGWSTTPMTEKAPRRIDLDLRISATHARLAPLTIDDAAFAIITRGERTEIALADGKAYGGTVKGRVSLGLSGDGLDLRGAGSLTDVDAAALSWDAFGRQVAAGTLAASANIETSGDSPSSLMHGLQGWAKGTLSDGEISGIDVGQGLQAISRGNAGAALGAMRSGRTPFASLAVGTRIADGVATFETGALNGPDAVIGIRGDVDFGGRMLGLRCDASPPGRSASAELPFAVEGSFDRPRLSVPERAP